MENQDVDVAGAQFDTDAILDVLEHLLKAEGSWGKHFADHGLDPSKVKRALSAFDVNLGFKAVLAAFGLGLQFGAMRLTPIELPEGERVCNCLFCQIGRAAQSGES